MANGNKTLIGEGQIRIAYLVEYEGRPVLLKMLKDRGSTPMKELLYQEKEVLALDAVSLAC